MILKEFLKSTALYVGSFSSVQGAPPIFVVHTLISLG